MVPRLPIAALTDGIEFVSMWRWTWMSLVVGVTVGLVAAGFATVLDWLGVHLGEVVGITGPGPEGEHPVWWLVLLLPAVGGLGCGLTTQFLAPETAGAGTNNVIDSFHMKEGHMRRRVPFVKAIATIFTLGTGGSGGREGPMAQIGGAVGVWLARALDLSARDRRLLLLAGAAGGISALFRAPLGAALWALEIVYREDFESDGMFPCLVTSVTAYSVGTLFFGTGSMFTVPVASYAFHPAQLPFYALLALGCAPFGVLWVRMAKFSQYKLWPSTPLPAWLKPACGGLLMGLLCVGVPWVFSSGYDWMQDALEAPGDPMRTLPIGVIGFGVFIGLGVAKMAATALTVGSGGSAGKFAPTLFIGGFIGGGFGLLFHDWAPNIIEHPGAFVLVGMGVFYASCAKAPIAIIILISELFGSYDLLVPLMFSEMIMLLLLRNYTLYPEQKGHDYDSPAHLGDFTIDILSELQVADYYTRGRASTTISAAMSISQFLAHVSLAADNFFVVHDKDDKLAGIVSLSNIRTVIGETAFLDVAVVGDAMWPLRSVSPTLDMKSALELFLSSGYDHLPVIDPEQPNVVLGMLSQQQIFTAYNAEILRRHLDAERDGDAASA